MLNPSVGDYDICDPTLNRCLDFARYWGFGGMTILNLFAYITPNPDELLIIEDPIGERNDEVIDIIAAASDEIVYAWGADYGHYYRRNKYIIDRLKEFKPKCILKSKKGHPRHPLYIKKGQDLIEF